MYRPLKKKNVVFIWVSLYLWFGKLANLIYGNIEYFHGWGKKYILQYVQKVSDGDPDPRSNYILLCNYVF